MAFSLLILSTDY